MSFVLYGLAAFLVTIVVYLLGVRFVGKPMAVYAWRFWRESPEMSPTIASILLFPFAHVTAWFNGDPFSRSLFIPAHGRPELFVPIIVGWYTAECKTAYIRNASWAWPLRLCSMALMGAGALCIVTVAALRWFVRGPVGRHILGAIES